MKQIEWFAIGLANSSNGFVEAEDLMQSTMLKALQAQSRFIRGTQMQWWLMIIMRNHCLSTLRRKRFFGGSLDDPLSGIPELPTTGGQEQTIFLKEALAAMATLPEGMRQALELVGQQYRSDEIASISGIALGTAKSRVSRGRSLLARMLNPAAVFAD